MDDEPRLHVDELRASRARVVAASDAERRRIERELHDGAQQQLVAIVVSLQLARRQVDSDPEAAKALIDEIAGDARQALEDLRAVARAIYPPLLVDRGLAEALRAAAAAAGIPARVDVSQQERHSPEVEAAVYFCCLEALGNAVERRATAARVRVWHENGALRFTVSDDGRPGAAPTSLGDRLGAHDGTLTISSGPRGTRLEGAIPR